MKKTFFLLAICIAAVSVFSCSDTTPTKVEEAPPLVRSPSMQALTQRRGTIDELWSNIAQGPIPGFAGIFLDPQGSFVVSANVQASEGLALNYAGVWRSKSDDPAAPIRFRLVKYDFRDLSTWRGEFFELLGKGDVVLLDADEVRNAVVVGVRPGGSHASVRAHAKRVGLPEDALEIIEAMPVLNLATVRSTHRPVMGGLEIRAEDKSECTLGFNTLYQGDTAFVTNSHCSTTSMALDSGTFRQNTSGPTIGLEVFDRAPFDGYVDFGEGYDCSDPPGCRPSDSQLSEYYDTVATFHGKIARTLYPSTSASAGSLTLHSPSSFYIDQKRMMSSMYVGQTVDKVGRTTGWTRGTVTQLCVDVEGETTNRICQTGTSLWAAPGDSGSPVFVTLSSSHVALTGLLWGRDSLNIHRYFSSLDGIEYDLGITLDVVGEPLPLSASITGAEEVAPDEECAWQAWTWGGTPPFSYDWWGALSGSTQTIFGELSESSYLWVEITDALSQADTAEIFIDVDEEYECDWK